MSIFNEFHQALSTAIDIYQAKKNSQGKSVSEHRQEDIVKLKILLAESENKKNRHPVLLRQNILTFVENLGLHPLAKIFPDFFRSELDKTIQEVLDHPNYSNLMLLTKVQIEADERQQRMLNYLEAGEVINFVESIDALEQSLELSERKYADLNNKYTLLQNENTQLKRRITELEKPTKSSQTESEKEPEKSRYTPSGVFT